MRQWPGIGSRMTSSMQPSTMPCLTTAGTSIRGVLCVDVGSLRYSAQLSFRGAQQPVPSPADGFVALQGLPT